MQTSLSQAKTIPLVNGATGAIGNYTTDEFKADCSLGKDIEFAFRGKGYTVLGWWEAGPLIGEQNKDDGDLVFSDADDMLDNYLMDGVRLRDAFQEIEVLLH